MHSGKQTLFLKDDSAILSVCKMSACATHLQALGE